MKYAGIDVGYWGLKIATDSGELILPSCVAPWKKRDVKTEINRNSDMKLILANLEIGINGQMYHVGSLANQGGNRNYEKEKYIPTSDETFSNAKILLLTGLALLAKTDYINPSIVICLPINDYSSQATKSEKYLPGYYEVVLPYKTVRIKLETGKVLAIQEGIAALSSTLLNPDGTQVSKSLYTGKRIGLNDFGWRTDNFFFMDWTDPDIMDYKDQRSGTVPTGGLSNAFAEFYKRITRTRDITADEAEKIFLKEGRQEIQERIDKNYNHIRMYWPDVSMIDYILFSGGGGQNTYKMWPYPQEKVVLLPNAIMANALGASYICRANFS
ncbi:MAG TPA: hypothetical protein DDW65_21660 [Firmicutes bacterium]|jgi:hypothetical protein|nr:hypothetical protein [Bacillota bacterium]